MNEDPNLRRTPKLCRLRLSGLLMLLAVQMVAPPVLAPPVLAPSVGSADELRVNQARSQRGMVVSVSPIASRVGRDMLQRGGNAVDAAVATAFALAVTWPEAGNIGGGGFMMVQPSDGRPAACVDYREMAPAAAHRTMFRASDGRHTHKIVGVPGTVRGLGLAHQTYGRLPWKDVVQPAVLVARDGFQVDDQLAGSMNRVLVSRSVQRDEKFAELRRCYGQPENRPWKSGDTLVLPDLARTLGKIAEQGPGAFYQGEIAGRIADEMLRGDGLITEKDLSAYTAKIRKPIQGTYRGFNILGPPPPSSGGICLIEALNMLEPFDLRQHDRYSAENMHLLAEVMRRIFCDRARYLGDGDFVDIPGSLTGKEHAIQLASSIAPSRATPSQSLAADIPLAGESENTTHFSVIDADGMAVANTYTLESSWGARIVARGTGFVLNNEMGDFNWLPGVTNRAGRIGTKPNLVAPHKRMLSSQTPTIVTRGNRVVLITGSPGGRTIINTALQIVLNVLEFEMGLPRAVEVPRLHHQWFPDVLMFEGLGDPQYQQAVARLRAMGHTVQPRASQGSAHSIWVDPDTGEYLGVADWRRGGLAAAVP